MHANGWRLETVPGRKCLPLEPRMKLIIRSEVSNSQKGKVSFLAACWQQCFYYIFIFVNNTNNLLIITIPVGMPNTSEMIKDNILFMMRLKKSNNK